MAISSLPADQQDSYRTIRTTLLSTYQVSAKSQRQSVFESSFNCASPDLWLRDFHLNFHQWLDTSIRSDREMMLMELATSKLPYWLQPQIRNLNCQSYSELTEAILRHLGNLKLRKEKELYRKEEKELYRKDQPRREDKWRELKKEDSWGRKERTPLPGRKNGPPRYTPLTTVQCFHCGKKGHMQREC